MYREAVKMYSAAGMGSEVGYRLSISVCVCVCVSVHTCLFAVSL